MSKARKAVGQKGEDLAAEFLEACGYLILERNWRHGHLEIDLIAQQGHQLVVVEVKTRKYLGDERTDDIISLAQQRALTSAGEAYLQQHPDEEADLRFDLVLVSRSGQEGIRHIPHIFIPGL